MLPLGLLNAAQGHPMLVELKNGETLNGHLVNCDNWMNLTLKEVVQTSPEGDKFVRLPEVYVKGNNIKYLRVPDEIVDIVSEQQKNQSGGFRGGRGGEVDVVVVAAVGEDEAAEGNERHQMLVNQCIAFCPQHI
ncbi:U6 snRNA-associated Sm-like protein LSm4 [Emericellopsis cladophorae]|uniref:LSM complex subunit LSM4 n=1 Tax=Emericellopsis cladophorae TaxID=2686198 RepID=A0A9P9Y135_9HYPO|nr:U6 snRNA-associated Sm-like protein LSm4 [Emericellopsis cladophorae]KAI6781420.1 U6 snRNA-associated Sm-like protein LSm4 [Emericellopsis cladophorae]